MKNLPKIIKNDLPAELPRAIAQAGNLAAKKYVEFFTAEIRNPNTRKAYMQRIRHFLSWCEDKGIALEQLTPFMVAAYIEELGKTRAISTVKQSRASIKQLFDYLVVGQVIENNPIAPVRGPKEKTSEGKTPVLFKDDARTLLASIDDRYIIGLRDKAIVALMIYSFARVGAVVRMKVKDYYVQGRRAWFVLHEKGSKYRRIPAHHKAVEYIERYIETAKLEDDPNGLLFRSIGGRGRGLSKNGLHINNVLDMIKRRTKAVGLPPEICCHTFRATGITNYMENGGDIETAAEIAGHVSTKTTQVYNRSRDSLKLSEIERIRI